MAKRKSPPRGDDEQDAGAVNETQIATLAGAAPATRPGSSPFEVNGEMIPSPEAYAPLPGTGGEIESGSVGVLDFGAGDGAAQGGVEAQGATPDVATPPTETAADPIRVVTLDLPLLRTKRYSPRHPRPLSGEHAQALRDLAEGLAHEGARVEGRAVRTPDDALAWLLEKLLDR